MSILVNIEEAFCRHAANSLIAKIDIPIENSRLAINRLNKQSFSMELKSVGLFMAVRTNDFYVHPGALVFQLLDHFEKALFISPFEFLSIIYIRSNGHENVAECYFFKA